MKRNGKGIKMKLLCDDIQGIYVWVEEHDENIELSPHFDYQEDAEQWRERVSKLLKDNKHE